MRSTDDQEDYLQHGRFGEGKQSVASRLPAAVWKATSIVGICLIVVGIAAGYVDYSFQFGFLSDHFDIFLTAGLMGVVASYVGLIGRAKMLKRRARVRMAGLVFVWPWIAGLACYVLPGNNAHGPGVFVLLLLIIPASILALVLLLMASLTNSERP